MQHADRLDLPKGHVDPGESEWECAFRELEEETGITRGDLQVDEGFRFETSYPVRPARYQFQPCQKTTIIFLARLLRDVPIQASEHLGFQWYPWHPPHRLQPQTIDPLLAAVDAYWNL